MNEVVRLIAFGIVIFAITVLALLLSVPDFSQAVGRSLGLIPPEAEGSVPRLAESDTVIRLYRPELGTWVGLEGFPSETAIAFDLPDAVEILGGQLQLDLATDLIENGDGLVRVLINGRERDALVLEPGETSLRLTYDLLPSDLALGAVTLGLDGNGTTNSGQVCPTNVTNLGAAVEILPSTGVLLQLEQPLTDVGARVAVAPDPLPLDGAEEIALAAWAAQFLTRQGVAAEPASAALDQTLLLTADETTPLAVAEDGRIVVGGVTGVAEVGRLRAATLPATYAHDWPLPVAALTSDLETHTFRGTTHWTLDYKLADLPQGRPPARLHLALRTSELMEGNQWTLRVLLNGAMLHSGFYPGDSINIIADIELPLDAQGLANQLDITLVDNTPNQGICRAGPEAAAQLLPETQLLPADAPQPGQQAAVMALAAADTIGLADQTQKGMAATVRAEGLLDLILPLDASVMIDQQGSANIAIVDAEILSAQDQAPAGNAFYLFPGTSDPNELIGWEAGAALPTLPDPQAIGLAITW